MLPSYTLTDLGEVSEEGISASYDGDKARTAFDTQQLAILWAVSLSP